MGFSPVQFSMHTTTAPAFSINSSTRSAPPYWFSQEQIDHEAEQVKANVRLRSLNYRSEGGPARLAGKVAIIVDDGLASGITMQAEADNARFIIDLIKQSVDPGSWVGEGGQGTITYSPLTKALVIRQSAEVHMTLKSGLK